MQRTKAIPAVLVLTTAFAAVAAVAQTIPASSGAKQTIVVRTSLRTDKPKPATMQQTPLSSQELLALTVLRHAKPPAEASGAPPTGPSMALSMSQDEMDTLVAGVSGRTLITPLEARRQALSRRATLLYAGLLGGSALLLGLGTLGALGMLIVRRRGRLQLVDTIAVGLDEVPDEAWPLAA
jgi:hypothetical protein